jgi:hypothetical protein
MNSEFFSYFLGIWLANNSDTVLWVAKRINPIEKPSEPELSISSTGNLVMILTIFTQRTQRTQNSHPTLSLNFISRNKFLIQKRFRPLILLLSLTEERKRNNDTE